MKIYLDTANLEEIREAASWGVLSGVTTNPTLLAREPFDSIADHIRAICQLVPESVSVEVVGRTVDEMVDQGHEIASWGPKAVVKIPLTPAGTAACRRLAGEGIATNLTMVCSVAQGVLAVAAGASYVCCYIGRVDDIGENSAEMVAAIKLAVEASGRPCQVMAASVRQVRQIAELLGAGVDVATVPFQLLRQMYAHPVTEAAISRFEVDWARRPNAVASGGKLVLR